MSECATVLESESTRRWCKICGGEGRGAGMPGLVAAACNPSGNAHNPGLYLYAGNRRPARRNDRIGVPGRMRTGLFGELVVLGAAVKVRPFGQPVEGAT